MASSDKPQSAEEKDSVREAVRKFETGMQDVKDLIRHPGWAWIANQLGVDLRAYELAQAKAATEFEYLRASISTNAVKHSQTVADRVLNRLQNEVDLLQDTWK
jgi:hypothetical protein